MHLTFARKPTAGFTLIELLIAVTVGIILMLAAAPAMRDWIFNTRVRTAAESLQNGLRQAQSEAVRSSRMVVVELRDAADAASTTNAVRWSIATVPLAVTAATTLGTSELLRTGRISESGGAVINGTVGAAAAPSRLCFNSMGMLVGFNAVAAITVNTDPAVAYAAGAAVCTAPAANSSLQFAVTHPNANRPLRVLVSNSGRVRMCDPARNIATAPDGCP